MRLKLVIKPQAEEDIRDIFEWYENKSEGLGESFLEDLERKIDNLKKQPEGYQFHHLDFRFAFLDRFPISIHFKFEANSIYVFGVFPTSKNPKKWRGK